MVEVLGRRAFVGRQRELARLLAMLGEVEGGAGRTVVVGGDAGVGKTRLVERFAELVAERALVLQGACLEGRDEGLPYAPIVEILRAALATIPEGARAAFLGPGRGELTRLLPELAPRESAVQAGDGSDPTAQARLFELIVGALERLAATQPLVVIVEDVQWADQSTRELLGLLSRALRDEQAMLVLTVRTDAMAAVSGRLAFLAELERDEHVERIDLAPFGRDEVMEQLESLLDDAPDASLVDRILARSDGNPFYVEELVLAGAGREDLPPVLRDVLAARVASLGPRARDVLRAAAAAGRRIDDDLLAAAIGIPPLELAVALREAVDAGILVRPTIDGEAVSSFRHALLQEAVDGELFPAERAALHAAFAQALEARQARDPRSVTAAELARHWDAAGEPRRALGPTVDAALGAERVYAWPEALRLWDRARDLASRVPDPDEVAGLSGVELTARAAECALLAGEYSRAVELGRAAVAGVDEAHDPTAAGDLHNRLRWYLWEAGDRQGAARAVDAALRLIPASPPSRARARALAQQAGILLFAGRHAASIAVAREAIAMATQVGAIGEAALALGVLGWDLAATGDVEGGLATFLDGRRLAETIGAVEGIALGITNYVALLDRVGRSRDSLAAALQGYEDVKRLGIARTYGGVLLGYAAKAQLAMGLWDDAERATGEGLRGGSSDRAELWLLVQRGRLLVWRGRFAEAGVLLRRAGAILERRPSSEFATAFLAAQGELAVERGDLSAVRQVAAAGLAALSSGEAPDPSLAWLAMLVIRGEADARERGDATATDPTGPGAGLLAHVEAAIEAALGDGAAIVAGERGAAILAQLAAERSRLSGHGTPEAWHAVVERWLALGRPYPAAYARFREAAAVLASGGDRAHAIELFRASRLTAAGLRAEPLMARIDALARAARLVLAEPSAKASAGEAAAGQATAGQGSGRAGAAPGGRAGGPDPFGFTAREREVLPLLAEGWTNQQIADALFITRKTASVHVSNILAKLGVANRAEAAAVAHRVGLVGGTPAGR
ncbi:MAG TPA: AAA family ATPase [Candidatus Limnocylindrales bacterium]|nr:AAA family ATPase [Candidatus Limnocylindrales bacterium]